MPGGTEVPKLVMPSSLLPQVARITQDLISAGSAQARYPAPGPDPELNYEPELDHGHHPCHEPELQGLRSGTEPEHGP